MKGTSGAGAIDNLAGCLRMATLLFPLTIFLCAAQSYDPGNFHWSDSIRSARSLTRALAYVDSADITTSFGIEKAERRLEFGLVSYDLGQFAGRPMIRIVAIDDTVIALSGGLRKDSGIYYDQTRWDRWNKRMKEAQGGSDDSIDLASEEYVAYLTSPFSFITIGDACGWGAAPPTGYCAVVQLIRLNDLAALRRVMRGPNLEGRIYAWLALRRIAATEEVGIDLAAAQRTIEGAALNSGVPTCGGCFADGSSPEAILKSDFLQDHGHSTLQWRARKCLGEE